MLLASDITVTEEEVSAFIEANDSLPEGQEETAAADRRTDQKSDLAPLHKATLPVYAHRQTPKFADYE